jgi:hypothetical protein
MRRRKGSRIFALLSFYNYILIHTLMETSSNKGAEAFKITGDWAVQSKALQVKYPLLTDADLACVAGKESELIARVETRLSKKHDEVVSLLRKAQEVKA